jgi:NADPH:quinone reductase-like Zn-dependent oxidoreductase
MVHKELIESGKVTPVIDRTYPLAEAPEGIRYLEGGRAQVKSSSPFEATSGRLV